MKRIRMMLLKWKRALLHFWGRIRKKGVFYINGPDTLPPPLEKEEELAWIARIDEPEAKNVLVERNLRLVVYIATRFEIRGRPLRI